MLAGEKLETLFTCVIVVGGILLPIIVISLPGSSRREACLEQFHRLGISFEFYDAIDGQILLPQDVSKHYDAATNLAKFKRPLTRSEIGCYLSHQGIWKKVRDGAKPIVVLEDDFVLSEQFMPFISRVPKKFLDGCFLKLDAHEEKRNVRYKSQTIIAGVTVGSFGVIPACTAGYIIGPRAAAQLLDARQHFFRPIDIDLKHYWEHRVPILGTIPALVKQRLSKSESQIESNRVKVKPRSKLRRLILNVQYQANFRFNLWIRHRHTQPAVPDISTEED